MSVDGEKGRVSPASVQRIWSARGLKPHLVKTFKISNDKHFEEKLHPDGEPAKLLKAVREFDSYLRANAERIPHYSERRLAGEAHLHRVYRVRAQPGDQQTHGQKQQMRWTPQGAHLLLQIRTRVLNDQLASDFHRWYPNFTQAPDTAVLAA